MGDYLNIVLLFCSVNCRRKELMRSWLALKKSVSRKFNYVSDAKIEDPKIIHLKLNSESIVNWGVMILNDLKSLKKENFNHSLCQLIPEVTKQKGGLYPGHILYQMVKVIQKYLNVNKLDWKLVEGCDKEFTDVKVVLDNTMKKRTAPNIGVMKHQAKVIMIKQEAKFYEQNILGEDAPEKLHSTVIFAWH